MVIRTTAAAGASDIVLEEIGKANSKNDYLSYNQGGCYQKDDWNMMLLTFAPFIIICVGETCVVTTKSLFFSEMKQPFFQLSIAVSLLFDEPLTIY